MKETRTLLCREKQGRSNSGDYSGRIGEIFAYKLAAGRNMFSNHTDTVVTLFLPSFSFPSKILKFTSLGTRIRTAQLGEDRKEKSSL